MKDYDFERALRNFWRHVTKARQYMDPLVSHPARPGVWVRESKVKK